MTDEKVRSLPVRFKAPLDEGETTFRVVDTTECRHESTYIIDDARTTVECGTCHTQLSPMWVLEKLAWHEHRYWRLRREYKEEMKRLTERSSTKCQHCKKMTQISRR